MTYKGHIMNGAVVLDQPVTLPEGAEVNVYLIATESPVSLAESLKGVIGKATGLPPDASSQKRHYLYGHPKS
jgi:predicted DNA-binding antitoxin AbrB/MazE fold protein